jgi:hypothetical protein
MKYWIESSHDFEDKEKKYEEHLVVACDMGSEGTTTVVTFDLNQRAEAEELVNHINRMLGYNKRRLDIIEECVFDIKATANELEVDIHQEGKQQACIDRQLNDILIACDLDDDESDIWGEPKKYKKSLK